MSDIVDRLRAPAYWISGSDEGHEGDNSAPMEAARTIEILRVELAKVNMENDRLTRTNRAKREHRDKLLAAKAKDAARIERLEAALRAVAELDVPRPVGHTFRQDGVASKHDKCWHGEPMYEECAPCMAAYARAVLDNTPCAPRANGTAKDQMGPQKRTKSPSGH